MLHCSQNVFLLFFVKIVGIVLWKRLGWSCQLPFSRNLYMNVATLNILQYLTEYLQYVFLWLYCSCFSQWMLLMLTEMWPKRKLEWWEFWWKTSLLLPNWTESILWNKLVPNKCHFSTTGNKSAINKKQATKQAINQLKYRPLIHALWLLHCKIVIVIYYLKYIYINYPF